MKKTKLTIKDIFVLGVRHLQKGNFQEAKKIYQKIIKIDPNHVQAHNNLGVLFNDLKDYQKAKNCYEKTIQLDPNFADAHYGLGLVL